MTDRLTNAERLGLLQADVQAHAKTITVLTTELTDVKSLVAQFVTERAVRVEVDKNMNDRLARIEKSIDQLTVAVDKRFAPWSKAAVWAASIVGASVLAACVKFIMSGGLLVVGP